jgi:hypothetical protein
MIENETLTILIDETNYPSHGREYVPVVHVRHRFGMMMGGI